MKRFEIWIHFPNGATPVKVETHKSMKAAKRAIDEMDNANARNEAAGFKFSFGRPVYTIREVELFSMD